MLSRSILAAAAVLVLAACDGDSDSLAAGPAAGPARPELSETLIRVPVDGGTPALYRVGDLAPLPWPDAPRLPAVAQVIGSVGGDRIVYLLDRTQTLLGLDLESARLREVVGGIAAAAAAPDGGVVAVDTAGGALRIRRRTPQPLRGTLGGTPEALYPTQRGGLLAPLQGGGLVALGTDHPPVRVPLPNGPSAATTWGELFVVGTDSGLVAFDPAEGDSVRHVPLSRPVHAVAFSPSGHRIYVATPDSELLVLDRFGQGVLETIALPGPAGALRPDRYGRWLLARPVVGDSLWVVDLVADSLVGSVRGAWSTDLPAVSGDRLVARQGDGVVVVDLRAPGLPGRGIVEDGGADRWTLVQWAPAGVEQPSLAADEPDDDDAETDDADADGSGSPVYLQVSSSRNPDWASDLVRQMRAAGLPAERLDPAAEGEPYRVVLGPYSSRTEADDAGRRLGRPYFIIADSNPAPSGSP